MFAVNIIRLLVACAALFLSLRGSLRNHLVMTLAGQLIGILVLISFAFSGLQ